MGEVLETARRVAEKSIQVWIDKHSLITFVRTLIEDGIKVPSWDPFYHFSEGGEEMVAYLLVLDTINFCFWPQNDTPTWEIEYRSQRLSGYYALAASLKKALESGIPITRADYLANLSLVGLKKILGGQEELQLLELRRQNLNELGKTLLAEFGGKAHNLVTAARKRAIALVRLLAEKLLSFRDAAEYQGHKVYFYKRAQLLAADLYGAFRGKGWGNFIDTDELTAFADYKLPQVLRHLGILHYEKALAQKVDQMILLEAGSEDEVEIRANTIWAVELIRQELNRRGKDMKAFEVDGILWNLGQKEEFKVKPYHRTVTIFY